MARASNPQRAQCEEYTRAEIARLGAGRIDRSAIVSRFVEAGASRARVQAWIADVLADPVAVDGLEADLPGAQAAVLPAPAELARLEAAADVAFSAHAPAPPAAEPVAAPAAPAAAATSPLPAVSIVPESARGVLEHLQSVIDTASRVLAYSHKPDGTVRNPRMALASADTLRRCLETALKLYEAINNVGMVERFMAEMLAEVRQLEPDAARRVVERMRLVQGRWAA